MKKFIILPILILLITFQIFAAPLTNTDLELGVNIGSSFGLIVHDSKANTPTTIYPTDITQWNNLSPLGTSDSPAWLTNSKTFAVSAMTNVSDSYTVKATIKPLATQNNSSKMGYSVKVGAATTSINKTETQKTITLMNITNITDLTFKTQEFKVELSETDLTSASSGTYSTVWTIEITASN